MPLKFPGPSEVGGRYFLADEAAAAGNAGRRRTLGRTPSFPPGLFSFRARYPIALRATPKFSYIILKIRPSYFIRSRHTLNINIRNVRPGINRAKCEVVFSRTGNVPASDLPSNGRLRRINEETIKARTLRHQIRCEGVKLTALRTIKQSFV